MPEFNGDLFIGGMRLEHLHGELATDQPLDGTADHLLAGTLEIHSTEQEQIELGRPYRLQIEDGPAGQVIVSRIDDQRDDTLVVAFEPSRGNAR
jgi:hypothetical protein